MQYSAFQKKEVDTEGIILSEINQLQKDKYYIFPGIFNIKIIQLAELENRMAVHRALREGETQSC